MWGQSKVLSKDVQVRLSAGKKWSQALDAMSVPAGSVPFYEEMMDAINSGWIDFGRAGTESVPATTSAANVFMKAKTELSKQVHGSRSGLSG